MAKGDSVLLSRRPLTVKPADNWSILTKTAEERIEEHTWLTPDQHGELTLATER
jgi:hypothetical protein